MRTHLSKRSVRRAAGAASAVVATAGVLTAVGAVAASPADATVCNQPGHAYLTQPGRIIFSDYDGTLTDPAAANTISVVQGNASFRVGGAGQRPGTNITFQAVDRSNGAVSTIFPGRTSYTTRGAGSNCVVNEEGPMQLSMPPGSYKILAYYTDGNTGNFINGDIVAVVNVQAPPPPPSGGTCYIYGYPIPCYYLYGGFGF